MKEDVIDDLKQFIATTVSQQLSGVATKDDIARLEGRFDKLEQKVDDVQASIGDALATSNDAIDAQLQDHELRITSLEHKPA